tara:strand:+ start:115 stop:648 length:534 start_codon:yes stop_codon:yes gene_type:complete
MQIKKVKISEVISNPNNPRFIKDYKFGQLVKSIREFPKMLKVRPIIINDKNIILGGNMRHKAAIEVGLKEVYVLKLDDLTEEEQKEFIIKDNIGFGEWDWDILANDWDVNQLSDWGLDAIKHDWEDLDYIDEDIAAPELEQTKLTITIPNEYRDEIQKLTNDLKDWITKNYLGCEVK